MTKRIGWLILVALLALVLPGCQAGPDGTPAPTVMPTATRPPSVDWPSPVKSEGTPSPIIVPQPSPSSVDQNERYPYPLPATPKGGVTRAAPTPTLTPSPLPPSPTPTRAHPVYSGPPLNRSEVGIQIHLRGEDVSLILNHLRALRVGWVKVQVSWKLYQPGPDRYDEILFHELDRFVSGAAASDIYLLLSVAKAPEWSRPSTELDGPPSDYVLYQDFMSYLATRYQGNVAAYELWNESNLRREWNGVPLSAADCVALIRAGAAGVKAADPLAITVSGAPAPTGIHDYVDAIDDRVYLREMLAAGVADVVDAIGVHPYGWANPPDSSVASPDPVAPTHNTHPSFFFRDTLWDYFSILNEAGRSEKQLWATEFGWGSFDGMEALPPAGVEYMAAVSEWQQATYTLRAYELAHAWRWVGPLFLWNLNFGPLLGTDFAESGYSALRPDGSPRPLYLALQTLTR